MFKLFAAGLIVVVCAASWAQGWSVAEQKARIKREDDKFFRKLPKDPAKRQRLMAIYLSQPYGERLLDGWRSSDEASDTPHTLKPKSNAKIAGRWKRMQGVLGSAFRITSQGSRYVVKFATWDGKGSEVFYRHASLRGSVLQLDRPVFDSIDHPFSKIYVVAAGKDVRLLPSADVAVLEKLGATSHRPQAIAGLTFHRV